METIGLWAGFILSLMVYSYIFRDNFLYRIAVYTFVGLAAGYITVITVDSVLLPWFDLTVGSGEAVNVGLGFLPLVLFILLIFKTSSRLARFGNLGMAFIVGVGAAVALVGAITGTLIPLIGATINLREGEVLNGLVMFIGVSASLLYFTYLARTTSTGAIERPRSLHWVAQVGQGFIVVTLGALYAAAILTSLTIFTERIGFMLTQLGG